MKKNNAYGILGYRWEYSIKMLLKVLGREIVDWILVGSVQKQTMCCEGDEEGRKITEHLSNLQIIKGSLYHMVLYLAC